MNHRLSATVVTLALSPGLLSGPALGQTAGVYVDIGPCMALEEDSARYACYDLLEEQIRAARARETPLPVVSLPRNSRQQQVEEPRGEAPAEANRAGEFGLEPAGVARGREANARVLDNEDGEEELVDSIASLEERLPNQWQITLASGQIWSQVNSKRFRLREGMEVRIYPSPFGGSFRLSATGMNGFIQVTRIQ